MRGSLRLGLVLLFLLLPPGAFLAGGWHAATLRGPFDLSDSPQRLAEHVATRDEPMDSRVLDALEPDAVLIRLYTARNEPPAWVYVTYYSGYGTTGAHDPAICYPSQGWDLSAPEEREVRLQNKESLTVSLFRVTQGQRRELVMHWFQPAWRWPRGSPEEPFLRVYEAFVGRKRYAFVRLSTPLATAQASEAQSAEQRLVRLASDLAPWVRQVLDRAVPVDSADARSDRGVSPL